MLCSQIGPDLIELLDTQRLQFDGQLPDFGESAGYSSARNAGCDWKTQDQANGLPGLFVNAKIGSKHGMKDKFEFGSRRWC